MLSTQLAHALNIILNSTGVVSFKNTYLNQSNWKQILRLYLRAVFDKLKINIHNTVILPVLVYGPETWAPKRQQELLLVRTEIRMIR